MFEVQDFPHAVNVCNARAKIWFSNFRSRSTKILPKIQNKLSSTQVNILARDFDVSMPTWYSQNIRRLFFDMHLPDWTQPGQSGGDQHSLRGVATRFEPEQLIKEFVRA